MIKMVAFCMALIMSVPTVVTAEPLVNGIALPPASFTRVEDLNLLEKIGLEGSAWCYDTDANAMLITAAAHERARCELRIMYEVEKEKLKSKLIIDNLSLRLDTLAEEHKEIILIKDQEIARLTEIAAKVPNDYSLWWATGGFAVGVLTTIAITYAVSK